MAVITKICYNKNITNNTCTYIIHGISFFVMAFIEVKFNNKT